MPVSLSQSHTAIAAGYHDAGPGLNAALRTLTTIIGAHRGERPGWWLPAAAHPDGVAVPASGAATTGTAHGTVIISCVKSFPQVGVMFCVKTREARWS
jgi:hypothetical protein